MKNFSACAGSPIDSAMSQYCVHHRNISACDATAINFHTFHTENSSIDVHSQRGFLFPLMGHRSEGSQGGGGGENSFLCFPMYSS